MKEIYSKKEKRFFGLEKAKRWWNNFTQEERHLMKFLGTLLVLLTALLIVIQTLIGIYMTYTGNLTREECNAVAKVSYDRGIIDGVNEYCVGRSGAWDNFWYSELPKVMPFILICVGIAWILHGVGFSLVR